MSARCAPRWLRREHGPYGTEAVDACVEYTSGSARYHGSQGAGHDDIAFLERIPDLDHLSSQPQRGIEWMPQARGTGSQRDRFPAPVHDHAAEAQVQAVKLAWLRAQDVQ